jgi:small subunit ribosomal protein S21
MIWQKTFQTRDFLIERDEGEFDGSFGGTMVKLLVRDKESIQEAVRRFRKLVERSGIKKEMRRREYYEKPSETKRRARLRAERRSKRNRMLAKR